MASCDNSDGQFYFVIAVLERFITCLFDEIQAKASGLNPIALKVLFLLC